MKTVTDKLVNSISSMVIAGTVAGCSAAAVAEWLHPPRFAQAMIGVVVYFVIMRCVKDE